MSCNEILEEEEETQLQCSLPLYLDSLFGVQTHAASEQQRDDAKRSDNLSDKQLQALKTDTQSVEKENEASKARIDKPRSFSSSIDAAASKSVSVLPTEQRYGSVESGFDLPARMSGVERYTCPQGCTVLSSCTNVGTGKLVSLFCIVMQVNPVNEVVCKSIPLAGTTVSMSSMLLGDPTKAYFKLTLWREASNWVERISPGDVLFLTNIKLKVWKGETVGHTMMRSSILNLHWPKGTLPARLQSTISHSSLSALQHWALQTHWYLYQNPVLKQKSKVCFVSSECLGAADVIFHFRGKVLGILSSHVIVVGDEPGRDLHLYIVGDKHCEWSKQLHKGIGSVFEFLNVTVIQESTQEGFNSLQTTMYSKINILPLESGPAMDILKRYSETIVDCGDSMVHPSCTFRKILEQRRNGRFKCCATLQSMRFMTSNSSFVPVTLTCSSIDCITQLYNGVYVGCDNCYRALVQDSNGIYCCCKHCAHKYPRANPLSSYYFRPLLMTLCDDSGELDVFVPHALVPQIVGSISATSIAKAKLSGDLQQDHKLEGIGENHSM